MSFIQFQEVFLEYLADSCHLDVEGWSSNAIINQFPTIFIILIKNSLSQQDYKLGAKFSTPSFTSSLSALMAMSLSSLIKLFSSTFSMLTLHDKKRWQIYIVQIRNLRVRFQFT